MTPAKKRIVRIFLILFTAFIAITVLLVYTNYLKLRKTLASQISERATEFIGQKVTIRDISLSFNGSISLYDISIENPEGFDERQLLAIKRLFLDINLKELLNRNLYFRNIAVHLPELHVKKDNRTAFSP